MSVSVAVRNWRIALVGAGVVLLVIGGLTLLAEVPPTRYLGIVIWLGAAIVIHDGIGAMAVLGVSIVLRKVSARVPIAVIIVVQSALAIGVIVTVLVIPAIIKKAIGTANPSILPLDYASNLIAFDAALAVASIVVILILRRTRRATSRSGS